MRPFNLKIERLEVGTHKSITLSTTFISSSHCLCNFFSIFLKFSHFHSLAALMGLLLKCRHLEALPFVISFHRFVSFFSMLSFCVYQVYIGFFVQQLAVNITAFRYVTPCSLLETCTRIRVAPRRLQYSLPPPGEHQMPKSNQRFLYIIKLKTTGSKLCQKRIMSADDIRNFDQRLCRSAGTIYSQVS